MNEHQAAEFFDTLNRYVSAKITLARSSNFHPATIQKRQLQLDSATSDLKEKLRDLSVETTE